jgi:ABC-type uncharacterized transport system substrate-binding protein
VVFILLALSSASEAQSPAVRVGALTLGLAPTAPAVEAFRQALREHGYVEGQNLNVEFRFAERRVDRLHALAAELVRVKVDVIVVDGTLAALAAKQATRTIPIVVAGASDPVKAGLVASLARPGGNITGLTLIHPELSAKRLQLLVEAVPRLGRVAVIWNPSNPVAAGVPAGDRSGGSNDGCPAAGSQGAQPGRTGWRVQRDCRRSARRAHRPRRRHVVEHQGPRRGSGAQERAASPLS